jgi:hypothetical protein
MSASPRFEDRLLRQLRDVVAERPAPEAIVAARAPRRTPRLALAAAGVAAATAAVALVATSGDVTTSAYAVTPRSDGRVTVSIHSLSDAAGLQGSLRAAGVPAVVDYVAPGESGCVGWPPDAPPPNAVINTTPGSAPPSSPGPSQGVLLHTEQGDTAGPGTPGPGTRASPTRVSGSSGPAPDDKGGVTFSVDPGDVRPGEKVYITTSSGTVSSIGMAITKTPPSGACATGDTTP